MNRLLKYEILKLFSYKTYIILVLILIGIFSTIHIYETEKVVLSDTIIVTEEQYSSFLKDIQDTANKQNSISIFQSDNSSFSSKNIIKTASDMGKLNGIEIESCDSRGVSAVLNIKYISVINIIFSLICVYYIYFKEKEIGIYHQIKTTRRGNNGTFSAKTLLLLFMNVFINIYELVFSFLIVANRLEIGNLRRSIQSVNSFIACELEISVIEMVLLLLVLRIVGNFVVSLLFSLFALKSSNAIIFLFSSFVFVGTNYALTLIDHQSSFSFFKYINFFEISDPFAIVSSYKNINILSNPVNLKAILFIVLMSIVFILLLTTLHIFKNTELKTAKLKIKKRSSESRKKNNYKSLLFFESYKAFISNKTIVILLLFLIAECIFTVKSDFYISPEDYYYSNYIEILQGELTQEKTEYIKREKEKIKESDLLADKLNSQYANGEISLQQLQKEIEKNCFSENRKNAFMRVTEQFEYIKEHPQAHFIYETGFKKLLNIGEENKYFGLPDIILFVFCLLIGVGGIFSFDNISGMNKLIEIMPRRKISRRNKFLSAVAYSTVLFSITFLSLMLRILINYGSAGLNSPIISITDITLLANISILEFWLLKVLVYYLICVCIVCLVFAFTKSNLRLNKKVIQIF